MIAQSAFALPSSRLTLRALATAACAALFAAAPALAQTYPSKPIRVVVNSAAGGLTDVLARLLATRMGAALGQTLVVDNRTGAAGLLGAEIVSKAEPDGHTIGLVASAFIVAPAVVPGTTFDAQRDVTPVGLVMSTPLILVTNPNSPYRNVAQVVADAKAKPAAISIATGGNLTMTHLLAEQFQANAGLRLIVVPYKGGGPALNDVMAGHVPLYFDTLGTSVKLVQEGRLRALTIVAARRSPTLPDVPTIAEAGYPGVEGAAWFAFIAPPHLPAAIVNRLNDEMNKALAQPEMRERLTALGGTIEGGTPKQLADLIATEAPRWAKLIKDRGITMQ